MMMSLSWPISANLKSRNGSASYRMTPMPEPEPVECLIDTRGEPPYVEGMAGGYREVAGRSPQDRGCRYPHAVAKSAMGVQTA